MVKRSRITIIVSTILVAIALMTLVAHRLIISARAHARERAQATIAVRELVASYGGSCSGGGFGRFTGCFPFEAVVLQGTTFDNEGLSRLRVYLSCVEVEYLNLIKTNITEDGLATLGQLDNVEALGLGGPGITDGSLRHVKGFRDLRILRLESCAITDDGLVHLEEMSRLKAIFLYTGGISQEGVDQLRQALPKTNVWQ